MKWQIRCILRIVRIYSDAPPKSTWYSIALMRISGTDSFDIHAPLYWLAICSRFFTFQAQSGQLFDISSHNWAHSCSFSVLFSL